MRLLLNRPLFLAALSLLTAATVARADDDPIAWRRVGGNSGVDTAFAEAKSTDKPLFLYWGAAWCPPCNQVKATLFKRREFIERADRFVAVYVDGDMPAAQALGTRFHVSGYPTMVLFRPDGTEITRLPGEAEPERYLQVLALGMNGAKPVAETLKIATTGGRGLVANDWRMLAWYSWDTADQSLLQETQVPSTLSTLAARCPATSADLCDRLWLKSAAAAGDDAKAVATIDRRAALAATERVLASPAAAREDFDVLTNAMSEIVQATTDRATPARARVARAADRALARLAADRSLSRTDRLDAEVVRVQVANLAVADPDAKPSARAVAPLSSTRLDEIRRIVAEADRETHDAYERQTVINAAADLLATAGLVDDSNTLLKNEVARSHSPYYFMLDLAANARKAGDAAGALAWYRKAYDGAVGPATRLQWGSAYVRALIDLAPDDIADIERAATQVIGEIDPVAASFEGRNRKSLSTMTAKLDTWRAKHGPEAAPIAARIAQRSRALCDRVADERDRCVALLKVT